MADSILRGTGFYGAAVAAIKNGIYKFYREKQKKSPRKIMKNRPSSTRGCPRGPEEECSINTPNYFSNL